MALPAPWTRPWTAVDPGTPPAAKTIAEIQGTGAASPLAGSSVTTRGRVTATFPTGGFAGYYVQTPGTGGDLTPANHAASDAVFVYSPSTVDSVRIGDYVELTGAVSEFFGMTQLNVAAAADLKKLTEAAPEVKATGFDLGGGLGDLHVRRGGYRHLGHAEVFADGARHLDVVADLDGTGRGGRVDEDGVRRRVVGRGQVPAGAGGLDVVAGESAGGEGRGDLAAGGDRGPDERAGGAVALDLGDGLGGRGSDRARVDGRIDRGAAPLAALGVIVALRLKSAELLLLSTPLLRFRLLTSPVPDGAVAAWVSNVLRAAVAEEIGHVGGLDDRAGASGLTAVACLASTIVPPPTAGLKPVAVASAAGRSSPTVPLLPPLSK